MVKKALLALTIAIFAAGSLPASELENLKSSSESALYINVEEESKNVSVTEPAVPARNNPLVIFMGTSVPDGVSDSGSPLVRLGVRKAAEEAAVAKCRAQIFSGCAVIGSATDALNPKVRGASGMAASFVPVPGAAEISAEKTWNGYGELSSIERKGILKSAEDAAVAKCQAQSHSTCVVTGSALGVCDKDNCSATGTAQAQRTAYP
jgi:hypothetical protein